MQDAAERLVNLALYLSSSPQPITAEQCRAAGLGYPDEQDAGAFIRMFERDKDALRTAGLVIDVTDDDGVEAYRLNPDRTFARPIVLAADEVSALKAVAAALADDTDFPFGEDLALALGRLGTVGNDGPVATTELADGASAERRLCANALAEAVQTRKAVTFNYTNAEGRERRRAVEPYGVFFREGLWYLAGRDTDIDAIRTFAVSRMRHLDVNPARPRTPDFERPAGFDVRDHERLPFQYGAESVAARIRFAPDTSWRAERLARGRGTVAEMADGSAVWTVDVANLPRLASWLVDEGPGLHAVDPPALVEALSDGLRAVVRLHG